MNFFSKERCEACNSLKNREIFENFCICKFGYFDDEINENCIACNYSCDACTK